MSSEYAKSKQGARRRQYKSKIETSDARKKREESAVVLRKNKRMESFAKRRHTQDGPQEQEFAGGVGRYSDRLSSEVQSLAELLRTGDPRQQCDATSKLRKMLSIGSHNPPIQDVVNANVVPHLVDFLRRHDQPQIQFEAAWALTNVCSGTPEQTKYVIELGAVPLLKELINSPSEDVKDQAIWALGNIAGDSPICRDFVLSFKIIEPVLKCLDSPRINTIRHATWAVSNFCRGKPQPTWESISPVLPVLCKLIFSSDPDVLTDACWALSYLSDGPTERIQAVLEMGVCRRIVELLLHHNVAVQSPALRIVGNIVTGDDQQTQQALNSGVVPQIKSLLHHSKKAIRKEAVWTISNITAGNRTQIQAVIDEKIFPKLIQCVNGSDFDIKREAAWALSNATASGSPDQIKIFVEEGIIPPMCELLSSTDTRMVNVGLDALENILKSGEKEAKDKNSINPYVSKIESHGGLDKLELLQNHTNTAIYEKVVNMLELYFGAEEDQNVAPNVGLSAFQFGFAASGPGNFNF